MFNFTMKQPVNTTSASTTPATTFTFNPPTGSQPQNVFGTGNTSQPFIFTGSAQNAPSFGPFSNLPSNPPSNSIFGTNQPAPAAQPTNVFASKLTGTTVKFNPVASQAPLPNAPATTNIFGGGSGSNNTAAPSPFGTTMFQTSNTPFAAAPAPSTGPLTTGPNLFPPPSTVANAFPTTTNTAPVTTSGFPWTTQAPNLFNVGASTAQPSPLNPPANTNTSTPFIFGSQLNATANAFPQPTTTTFFNNTTPFSATNPINIPPATATSNIFPGFALPPTNNFLIQPTVPPTAPLPFSSSATNLFNPTGSTVTGPTVAGTQPAATSSASTLLLPSSQPPKQEQKTEQTTSIIQQNFLAASLLDPYANRGKKDFSNLDQIQAPAEPTVVSTVSTSITTATITTTAPITIPIQANLRKTPPSRSLVDVNFKLRPVSSSPALNEDVKPSNQPSNVSTKPAKSGLAGSFTDEEELVLLGRTKMSKLRISNDVVDAPTQSNPLRSLYPIRRLAELEKFANITPRSSTPPPPTTTTTVQYERTSHSASNSRDASPNPRFTPTVNPQQPSSPIVQRKTSYSNNQNYRLPILTRKNYYMKPSAPELKLLFNDKGECILKKFTVGHEIYGSVTFYGQINVAGLNLDEIIEIKQHEVTVYPNDDHKPPVGEELNVQARITLLGIYPTDRTTRQEITDIERIKAMHYNDYLREVTKKFDGEFINYDTIEGSWTFMVKHFTRYGLDDEHDDFIIQS